MSPRLTIFPPGTSSRECAKRPGTAVALRHPSARGIYGSRMPPFEKELGGWERLAMIAYLTSLAGPRSGGRTSAAWADTLKQRHGR